MVGTAHEPQKPQSSVQSMAEARQVRWQRLLSDGQEAAMMLRMGNSEPAYFLACVIKELRNAWDSFIQQETAQKIDKYIRIGLNKQNWQYKDKLQKSQELTPIGRASIIAAWEHIIRIEPKIFGTEKPAESKGFL